jgi:lipopolysaccharide transport system permease protein
MVEFEIKSGARFSIGLRELWRYRELFYFYTWRDIKVRYKQSFFGFTWAVIQPLSMMLLFTFFFGKTLKVPSDGIPYPIFVFTGLLIWNIFSSGLLNAGNSMITNANIIKKIYFPRLIIPLSSVLVALFDFLMAFIIYIFILIYYGYYINLLVFIPALLFAVLLTVMTTFGLGTFLAALNVKYRDFRYVIPFLIQALLFVTPVIYSISIIENPVIKFILDLNPLSGAITCFRGAVTGNVFDTQSIIISSCSSLLMLISGIFYFRKTESYFADIA